jgi:hypothetical protein
VRDADADAMGCGRVIGRFARPIDCLSIASAVYRFDLMTRYVYK